MIPFAESQIARETVHRQQQMFAMFVGPGLHVTRAALAAASGVPASTLRDLAAGSAITVAQLMALRRFLPPEAINMVTEPGGAHVIDTAADTACWDEVAADAAGLLSDIMDAKRDGVVCHMEDARLRKRTRSFIAKNQHMALDG